MNYSNLGCLNIYVILVKYYSLLDNQYLPISKLTRL